MSFISDYVTPFLGKYHRWIEGSYLATQLQYKGGEDAGTNYIDKVDRYNIRKIQSWYPLPHTAMTKQYKALRTLPSPHSSLTTSSASFSIVTQS